MAGEAPHRDERRRPRPARPGSGRSGGGGPSPRRAALTSPTDGPLVEAAGGVVWRRAADGIEVLLVHRPLQDDWSFPKGKLDPGEDHLTAALREVEEETGLRCRAVEELSETRYTDRHGRPKRVRYWSMEVEADPGFAPNDEVDELRWVARSEAAGVLTYEPDRGVVAGLRPPER